MLPNLRQKSSPTPKIPTSPEQGELFSTLSDPTQEIIKVLGEEDIYQSYPFLETYREILGEINPLTDVFGKGFNGIIVKSPRTNSVFKIYFDEKIKERHIEEESNQSTTQQGLQLLKAQGKISSNVFVPKIFQDRDHNKGLVEMEHIRGQSLKSYILRRIYQEKLKAFDQDTLASMTDYNLEKLLRKLGVNDKGIDRAQNESINILLKQDHSHILEVVNQTIDYLKSIGIELKDIHTGNIMIGQGGEIYIIDFGSVKIDQELLSQHLPGTHQNH